MRKVVLIAFLFSSPVSAAAQTTPSAAAEPTRTPSINDGSATAAGVTAFVRGDYTQAVALLNPLLDKWTTETNEVATAAFFMATLYDYGLGVPQDRTRACALYARSEIGGGPFARLAGELMRATMESLGSESASNCVMLITVGVNHGFVPARFTLAPEHWVALDLSSRNHEIVATVSYRGQEKSTVLQFPVASGAVFLPSEHTALPAGDATTGRHFVEVAAWVPLVKSRWQLTWALSEIVQGDATHIADAVLTTIESDLPPSDVPLELRELVTLQLNEAGVPEFAILDGPDVRREVIPSQVERRELEDLATKRKTADERVNWKRRRDPARPPSFTYADADGCGDLLVYGWSAERGESIAIRTDRELLQLSPLSHAIDLAAPQVDVEVFADVFERPQRRWNFCTDVVVREEGNRQETWRAVGGTLSIQLSPPGIRPSRPNQYRATVQIDNAEFMGPGGERIRAPGPIRLTAVAGSPWNMVP